MTLLKTIQFAFALPKCSIYRRAKLYVLKTEITGSMLCAFVFWVILGFSAGAVLFLAGSLILKSILG